MRFLSLSKNVISSENEHSGPQAHAPAHPNHKELPDLDKLPPPFYTILFPFTIPQT